MDNTDPLKKIDARIAKAQARLAREEENLKAARAARRKLETGQKILLGGSVLADARHDQRARRYALRKLEEMTGSDAKRVASLIEELKAGLEGTES